MANYHFIYILDYLQGDQKVTDSGFNKQEVFRLDMYIPCIVTDCCTSGASFRFMVYMAQNRFEMSQNDP